MKAFTIFIYFVVATILNLVSCKDVIILEEKEYKLIEISNSSIIFAQITEILCEDIQIYYYDEELMIKFEETSFIQVVEYKGVSMDVIKIKFPNFLSLLEMYEEDYFNNTINFENLKETIKCTNKKNFFNSNNIDRRNPPFIMFSNTKQTPKFPKEIISSIDITSQYSSMVDFNKAGLLNLLYEKYEGFYNFGEDEIYTENGKSSLIIERIMKLYSYWKYTMYHEKLRVCTKNYNKDFKDNYYYFFDIERLKKESSSNFYSYLTVIAVYYKGKSLKDCSDNNEKWSSSSSKNDKILKKEFNTSENSWVKLPLEDLIRASVLYILKFPNYKLLSHNCQHFATGMFNYITKQKSKVTNWYYTLNYDKVNQEFEDFFQCRITNTNLR